jgi:hypothetical protein
MRILLAISLVLTATLAAAPADARDGARSSNTAVSTPQARARGSSAECDRARDADPAGNYAGYPCWAQWAFAPKH